MKTLIITLLTTFSAQAFADFDSQVLYCAPTQGQPNGLNIEQAILDISTEHPEASLHLEFLGSDASSDMGMDYEGSDESYEMVSTSSKNPYYLNTGAKKNNWALTLKHESIDTFSQLTCAELDSTYYVFTNRQLEQVVSDQCFAPVVSRAGSAVIDDAQEMGVDYPDSITFKSLKTLKKGSHYQVVVEARSGDLLLNVKTEMKDGYCQATQD